MVNWFSTMEPIIYRGEKTVPPGNETEKTGQPYAITKTGPLPYLHHTQKPTQSGLNTLTSDLKP